MLPGFVGTMENLPRWWQINHLRLDFHLCEGLAVLDTHHAAHHLEQNDVVPQVPLYPLWLLGGWCLLVGPVRHFAAASLRHWEDVSSSWSRYTPQ